MAEIATVNLRLREGPASWPLTSMWVTGGLLEDTEQVEHAEAVLCLDLPAADLPWLARHDVGEWVSQALGLGTRPVLWCYRPASGPAWNARHRRVLRFWSDQHGGDQALLNALAARRGPSPLEPPHKDWSAQLCEEHGAARRHLAEVLDRYHHRDWRRRHTGSGTTPEDQLWRAAQGLREIEDALAGPAS